MIKFIHLADLHLGYRPLYLGEKAGERERDFLDAFRRAVAYAVDAKNQIDFVLIAGDLFDRHDPPEILVAQVSAEIGKLSSAGIPVYIVPGTHDGLGRPGSIFKGKSVGSAKIVTNTDIGRIDTLTVDDTPVHIYSVANIRSQTKSPLENFRALDDEGIHIACLHAEVMDGDIGADTGEIRLTKKMIGESNFDYIALGHYHNNRKYRERKTVAVYPGTLEGKDFTEKGQRSLAVVSIEDGEVKIHGEKFNQRELKDVHIDPARENFADSGELVEHIKKLGGPDLIMRVSLEGVSDFVPDVEEIQSLAAESFYHLEVVDRTDIVDSDFINRIKDEKTIRGMFVRKMVQKIDSAPPESKPTFQKALKLTLRHFGE